MNFKIKCFIDENVNGVIFTVNIYDSKNKLVYKGKTNYDGTLDINFPYGVYKFIVISKWGAIYKVIFVNPHLCNTIPFLFNENIATSNVIFTLTDQHYKDLPIKEGVINLWHNNI